MRLSGGGAATLQAVFVFPTTQACLAGGGACVRKSAICCSWVEQQGMWGVTSEAVSPMMRTCAHEGWQASDVSEAACEPGLGPYSGQCWCHVRAPYKHTRCQLGGRLITGQAPVTLLVTLPVIDSLTSAQEGCTFDVLTICGTFGWR